GCGVFLCCFLFVCVCVCVCVCASELRALNAFKSLQHTVWESAAAFEPTHSLTAVSQMSDDTRTMTALSSSLSFTLSLCPFLPLCLSVPFSLYVSLSLSPPLSLSRLVGDVKDSIARLSTGVDRK